MAQNNSIPLLLLSKSYWFIPDCRKGEIKSYLHELTLLLVSPEVIDPEDYMI